MMGIYAQIPRTGSTVITALLRQRDDVFMPISSPVIELFWRASGMFEEPNYRVELADPAIFYGREAIIRGMLNGLTEAVAPGKLWIDKHWNWANLVNLKSIREYHPGLKLFRIVRPWADIEASFQRLKFDFSAEKLSQIRAVNEALDQTTDPNLLTINFADVTTDLPGVMQAIEAFLDLTAHKYDFANPTLDTSLLDSMTATDLHRLRAA